MFSAGQPLNPEYTSGYLTTEFTRYIPDSAETETYENNDWAIEPIEYTCVPWSRALASEPPVDVSLTVWNSEHSEMSATLEATCEYAPCLNSKAVE